MNLLVFVVRLVGSRELCRGKGHPLTRGKRSSVKRVPSLRSERQKGTPYPRASRSSGQLWVRCSMWDMGVAFVSVTEEGRSPFGRKKKNREGLSCQACRD